MSGNPNKRRRWLFPEGKSGSAIILTPSEAPNAGVLTRDILMTVSEISASSLVLWYPKYDDTLLKRWPEELDYKPSNLRIVSIINNVKGKNLPSISHTISNNTEEIKTTITEHFEYCAERKVQPILLFDSLSAFADSRDHTFLKEFVRGIVNVGQKTNAQLYLHLGEIHRSLAQSLSSDVDLLCKSPVNKGDNWIVL